MIKVEYHKFEENNFCSGSVFVARHGGKGMEEDDGWIVTFVHNEETDVTQVSCDDKFQTAFVRSNYAHKHFFYKHVNIL